jgi:NAD(P)-dependent dehydrogenase (short-subunit alcohol dehydrogenase family)
LVSRSVPEDTEIKKAADEDRVKLLKVDLSNLENAASVVDDAVKAFGQLDGLVLNHGVLDPVQRVGVEGGNVEDWRRAFDINFFSALSIVSPTTCLS